MFLLPVHFTLEEELGPSRLNYYQACAHKSTTQEVCNFHSCSSLPSLFELQVMNHAKLDKIIKATRCIKYHSLQLS